MGALLARFDSSVPLASSGFAVVEDDGGTQGMLFSHMSRKEKIVSRAIAKNALKSLVRVSAGSVMRRLLR